MEIIKMDKKYADEACKMLMGCRDVFPNLKLEGFRKSLLYNIRRGTVICAAEDELMGYLIYSTILTQISFLLVDPKYRGRGIGEALVRRALDLIGSDTVYVEAYCEGVESAVPARALYHKLGFEDDIIFEGFLIPEQRLTWTRKLEKL